ncbi:Alcohol dehydrogenase GroES domain protein [Verrucomicrobia bacterium]|nr:Alcohol dehydrogenase GroES domain protein [Verrucomicrobiota bacterium]
MKAMRLIEPRHPLEARETPLPTAGPQDVLVQVRAAGICHSDAHYRAGRSPAYPLPLTLGHEVAGEVAAIGTEVTEVQPGDRVCLHYLATCGKCEYCARGTEQFCPAGKMIGKHRDGGYAEFIAMPARSVFPLPAEIPFPQGAIMMCSSATALHALNKARLVPGESVAVFGAGGLGFSAIQLAKAMGASQILAVDITPPKLAMARRLGATPINAKEQDAVREIKRLTGGRGADVALELIGLPLTMRQAVQALAIGGRAALVGITDKTFELAPYSELLNKEAEIIGVSDHLARELPRLIEWVRQGKLDLSAAINRTLPLEAGPINEALDNLEGFREDGRVVIVP